MENYMPKGFDLKFATLDEQQRDSVLSQQGNAFASDMYSAFLNYSVGDKIDCR